VTDKLKNAALIAFRLALRPLVRMLLRNGVTWKEAAEVCKQTYVEVARDDYGVHGRPTNASRIAILTGLSRHEVKRVHDGLAEGEPVALARMNRATRLLGGWHNDPDFCDAAGQPAELGFAVSGKSFSELCRRYAADIPPTAMLKELQRVGAVTEISDGVFRAAMRYYMPDSQDPDAVLRTGSVLEDIGNTAAFNLDRDKSSPEPTRFEGRASSADVRVSAVKEFRAYLETEAQGFLERVDDWLSRHEKSPTSKRPERSVRLGVGVYQIQDDEKRSEKAKQ
jgi:hypothetical protein